MLLVRLAYVFLIRLADIKRLDRAEACYALYLLVNVQECRCICIEMEYNLRYHFY